MIASGTEDTGDSPVEADDIYRVLANQRRRHVLRLLVRRDGPHDISSLAGDVAALENGSSDDGVPYAHRKSVYTGLYQNHLPMMEEAGFIRSDRGWDRIQLTERGTAVGTSLKATSDAPLPWDTLASGTVGIGVGLILGTSFAGVQSALIPNAATLGVVLVGLSCVSFGYAYHRTRRDEEGDVTLPPSNSM